MREMSVSEQRYKAVLAVVADGRTVKEVAHDWGVSRQTLHSWLARYEAEGLEGLGDRSHRPERCPHQMPAELEVMVLEMRSRTGEREGWCCSWPVRAWIRCRRSRPSTAAWSGPGLSTRCSGAAGGTPGSDGSEAR